MQCNGLVVRRRQLFTLCGPERAAKLVLEAPSVGRRDSWLGDLVAQAADAVRIELVGVPRFFAITACVGFGLDMSPIRITAKQHTRLVGLGLEERVGMHPVGDGHVFRPLNFSMYSSTPNVYRFDEEQRDAIREIYSAADNGFKWEQLFQPGQMIQRELSPAEGRAELLRRRSTTPVSLRRKLKLKPKQVQP